MKVLIVYAHPNLRSFNRAVLEAFTKGLSEGRHTYEVVDLYSIRFNPCLGGEDLANLMAGKTPDDIKEQQEKVSRSDGIVFIHPVWWTGPPAILKGWIDRVFSMGFAYRFDERDGHPFGLVEAEERNGDQHRRGRRRGCKSLRDDKCHSPDGSGGSLFILRNSRGKSRDVPQRDEDG